MNEIDTATALFILAGISIAALLTDIIVYCVLREIDDRFNK